MRSRLFRSKSGRNARKNDDFPSFAPYLEKMVALNQNLAEAIGYEAHPYDALLHKYEPGMTVARLDRLFRDLKEGLGPVLERAIAAPATNRDFLIARDYPVEQQTRHSPWKLSRSLVTISSAAG